MAFRYHLKRCLRAPAYQEVFEATAAWICCLNSPYRLFYNSKQTERYVLVGGYVASILIGGCRLKCTRGYVVKAPAPAPVYRRRYK